MRSTPTISPTGPPAPRPTRPPWTGRSPLPRRPPPRPPPRRSRRPPPATGTPASLAPPKSASTTTTPITATRLGSTAPPTASVTSSAAVRCGIAACRIIPLCSWRTGRRISPSGCPHRSHGNGAATRSTTRSKSLTLPARGIVTSTAPLLPETPYPTLVSGARFLRAFLFPPFGTIPQLITKARSYPTSTSCPAM